MPPKRYTEMYPSYTEILEDYILLSIPEGIPPYTVSLGQYFIPRIPEGILPTQYS